MRSTLFLLGSLFLFSLSGSAQEIPKVDLFAGVSYVHVTGPSNPSLKTYGGVASASHNFNSIFGAVVEFGAYANGGAQAHAETLLIGPKVSIHKTGRIVPFAQWLLGFVRSNPGFNHTVSNSIDFAESLGVGFDINTTRHLAIRLGEADFLVMKQPIFDPSSGTNTGTFTEKSFCYSGGVVFRF
jgi:hypothetical protein